jgi:nicotinamidase-related amidase
MIHKQRVGAFSENELHLILRARSIRNLVLFGITTNGIVLSTLRRAFDLDYGCVVLKEACFDRDEEVHRVLGREDFPGAGDGSDGGGVYRRAKLKVETLKR